MSGLASDILSLSRSGLLMLLNQKNCSMSDVSITSLSGSILNPFKGSWLILTSNIIYSTALVLALPYLEMLFLSRLLRRWPLSSPFSVVAPSPFSGNWTRIIYFEEYHRSPWGEDMG
jgi:hypothetical protein